MTAPLHCDVPQFGPSIPLDVAPVSPELATGRDISIVVIDTGAANPGTTGDRSSCIVHGTVVASVIKQMAPDAKLHSLRHSPREDSPQGTVADLIQAINAARDIHARIINISMVACEDIPELRETVLSAQREGALIVASAGNRGQCEDFSAPFPASIPDVLSVGAVEKRSSEQAPNSPELNAGRIPAEYTAPGAAGVLYAPGGPVSGTLETEAGPRTIIGGPDAFYGTSFAAPVVTGAAALVWEIAPFLSPREIADVLSSTAIPGGAPLAGSTPLLVVDPQAAVEKAWSLREVHDGSRTPKPHQTPATLTTVSSQPVSETPRDYSVPLALSAVLALVLVATLVARAFSSESKPPSGSAEITRQGT